MRRPARIAPGRVARPVPTKSAGGSGHRPDPAAARPGPASGPAAQALLQAAVAHHQAGRLDEAERQYRQVLAADPTQPDALHLLGVLAFQAGRPDTAVAFIEQAILLRPAAAAFRMNLGNALLALGRADEAVASYREATSLAPRDPEAAYNLGNALVQVGQTDDGIAALRRALMLSPEHVAARYNLANALRAAGRLDEAVAAYAAVIRQQPTHVDAHTNLGSALHALGRVDEAVASFERALAARPDDPAALTNLGEALREQGQFDAATAHLRRALAIDPGQPTALRSLAALAQRDGRHAEAAELLAKLDDPAAGEQHIRALVAAGRPEAALETALRDWQAHPDHRPLLRALVELLHTAPADLLAGPGHAPLLAACADDAFDPQELATPVWRLVGAAPEYPLLLATVLTGTDPLAAGTPLPEVLLHDPLVLRALPRAVFCATEVERIFTVLRRSALLAYPRGVLPHAFLCALAGAAFLVEHAWTIGDDEAGRLAGLRAELAERLADPAADLVALEDRLVLAALYDRLGRLPGAERLAAAPDDTWSPPFAAVVREQVREPLAEQALAAALPTLTPVDDAVSQAVRAMYEENPYPRWRGTRSNGPEPLASRFRLFCPGERVPTWPTPLPVLVAGAGTGRHPIHVALRLVDADVLAVDLSRSSLAYGARMAEQMGVRNIRFAQADILALDGLKQRFAHVECAGVLHHLADPLAGWAVLRRLLRPDGLMLIALYSERARASVVAARAVLEAEGFSPTSTGIRAARHRIMTLPSDHPAATLPRFWDFYSESGFRDLAMHVQEHRFTPLQLAAALDALDLRFLGFEVPPAVRERFRARFPQAGADRDLECWDQYEAENPDTFVSMFQLWCRPR